MKHLPLLSFYFLLGFCFQFPSVAMRYWMMNDVKVSPAQMSAMMGVASIPWCLKPFYGFISDSYPIQGYRRRPYMIAMAFLSSFMWIILPFVPYDEFLVTFVMTMASFGLCFADVMADSLLVEVARNESEKNRGIIQSWSWMLRFTGGLMASGFGALAYDKLGSAQVFLINSMVPVCIAVLAAFIPDEHTGTATDWKETGGKLMSAVKNPSIYRPALFLFMICVTPGYGGVMTFFYERELGFTPAEFGALDVLGFIVQILGTYIYKKWLRKVSFPKIFGWALLISFILENTLLILVLHINRDMGIPDYVFAFAERVVITLAGQFITMPMVVLGARVCPVGIEGTLYALLMSITNLGGVVSSEWGSLLTTMFGITSTNFTNLWKLMLLCNAFDLIPLGCIRLLRGISTERPI
jgi:folate/biopterin transporter